MVLLAVLVLKYLFFFEESSDGNVYIDAISWSETNKFVYYTNVHQFRTLKKK